MFQFASFPSLRMTRSSRVGFPHSDTHASSRLHTPERGLSRCTPSFIGNTHPGIPCLLLLALLLFPPRCRGAESHRLLLAGVFTTPPLLICSFPC
jgi:hypothetical protein